MHHSWYWLHHPTRTSQIITQVVQKLSNLTGSFKCCSWMDAAFSNARPASFPRLTVSATTPRDTARALYLAWPCEMRWPPGCKDLPHFHLQLFSSLFRDCGRIFLTLLLPPAK